MSAAVFRVMLLGLLRDRGALVMSFVVPAVFFLIFASIFTASSGAEFAPKIAVAGGDGDPRAERLKEILRAEPTLRLESADDEQEVRARVRRGSADAGLVIRSLAEPSGYSGDQAAAPFLLIADPAREVAVYILGVQLRRAYLTATAADGSGNGATGIAGLGDSALFDRENVAGEAAGLNEIAYAAGAVAVLFLLFAAVHGAVTLFEEQESGILERIVAGPGSIRVLVNGKFLYLLVQGSFQVALIFVVAWLVHGVDLPGNLPAWTAVTVATAAAAAGIALALTTACSTRQQAQNVGTIAMLILSALGGSMVPRFIMPQLLQDIGWFTPNAWALDAYTSIFWRGDPGSSLVLPVAVLLGTGLIGLALAQVFSRRLESL